MKSLKIQFYFIFIIANFFLLSMILIYYYHLYVHTYIQKYLISSRKIYCIFLYLDQKSIIVYASHAIAIVT